MPNNKKKNSKKRSSSQNGGRPPGGPSFVTSFVHYRTGKRIYASDYGLKCFPIGGKKRK